MTEKITIDRSVLEQALESLEIFAKCYSDGNEAIAALRAALVQPQVEQEPVAWMNANMDMSYIYGPYHEDDIPLYTHPQPPRQPLTDEEIKILIPDGDGWKYEVGFAEATEFARAIERAHGIGGEE